MDYRQKMVVASQQKYKNEDDDDEDIEALRLAALQSLRTKDAAQNKKQSVSQIQKIVPQVVQTARVPYKNQRLPRRGYFHNRLQQRQNGNLYYQSPRNPNLIAIVPVDEHSALQQTQLSCPVKEEKTDTGTESHSPEVSKFQRFKDNASGSEEEDNKDQRNAAAESKPETTEKCSTELEESITEPENQTETPESQQKNEEEQDQDVNDDDDDILLMADLEEEDSLERLMDEMEREMNVDKPSEKREKKSSKRENRESSKPEEPTKVQDQKTKPEETVGRKEISSSLGPPLSSKSERRSVSPHSSNRIVPRRRSLSPRSRPRKKSPRRSPRRSPSRQIKKSQRDTTRYRSPRKSPPRYSPRSRSPKLSPRRSPRISPRRSPRLSPRRSPNRSPIRRSPLRKLSPRGRSPRHSRSPKPRSRSPRISSRSKSPRPRSPMISRSRSPRLARSRSPRLARSRSPRLARSRSPRFSPLKVSQPRSPRSKSPRLSPRRLSPRRPSPRAKSPGLSPRRSSPRRGSPRMRSPKASPRRISPRQRSPRPSPRRSPWSSPRNSPRLSPRRRRSPKESKKHGTQSSDNVASPLYSRDSSPTLKGRSPDANRVKSKQREENLDKGTSEAKESADSISDPVLEARRRKFESTKPIDPINANKKIKLSKKDTSGKKLEEGTELAVGNARKIGKAENYDVQNADLRLEAGYEVDEFEGTVENASPITVASSINCVEVEPSKTEKERPSKKKKKRDKELYQVGKLKSELPLSERIGKDKKCKKRKDVVSDSTSEEVDTVVEDVAVDEEGDLRAELSRRRAERLNRTVPIQSARLVQSAFKGVVNEVVKNNAKVNQRHVIKSDEKTNQKEVRRVTVLHRPVSDLHDSEDESTLDSKVPVRFRLGLNKQVQDSRESKASRKASKRQGRKVKHKNNLPLTNTEHIS